MYRYLLFLGLTLFLFSKDFSIDDYKFKYTFNVGSETTLAAIQDNNGFLWFGTFFSDLVRFDGTNAKQYRASKNGVTDHFVTQVFEDSTGIIWAGSANGLTAYNRENNSFTQYFEPKIIGNNFAFSSSTIIEEKDGTLWFGTTKGISKRNPRSGKFTHYQTNNNTNSLSSNEIYSVFLDKEGVIWIGTKNAGLNRYNKKTDDFTRFVYKAKDIHSITEDKNGNLWLGSKLGGLILFNKKSYKFTLFDEQKGLPVMEIWNLKLLKNGYILLTSSGQPVGLVLFNPITKKFLQKKIKKSDINNLSSNSIHYMLEDKFGITWVTHHNGKVDKYDPSMHQFKLYKHNPDDSKSLSSNTAVPIYEDKNKNIWIGHFAEGLDLFQKETNTFKNYKAKKGDKTTLPHNYPAGFFEDKDGNFIVSTAKGMVVFDPVKEKVTKILSTNTWFYTILADNKNPDIIWANGWQSNFNRFNLKTREHKQYKHDNNDPSSFSSINSIRFIEDKDDANIFWIATWGGGLDRFDKISEKFTHFQHDSKNKKSIISNSVFDVFEDSRGLFWVCTDKGLNLFDKKNKSFEYIKLADARTIHNVQEDDENNLWFASDIGLIHFDATKKEIIKIYTTEDGLHSHGFFATARGKTSDGQLWYGGTNGLNSFYPSKLKKNRRSPQIFLTSIKQDAIELTTAKSLENLKNLKLQSNKNYFEFEYIGLNFTNSKKNQYKYFLEGYDQDWFTAKNRKSGRYVNLPSGEYTLRIKGANSDLYWSTKEQEVALKITIVTPWYKTYFAYFIYAISFIYIIKLIFKWKLNRIKMQNILLEETIDKRTHELKLANKKMSDSIEYAALIQYSIIPEKALFKKHFQDSFSIWQPKDIVGGDIYLLEEINEDELLLMVIDCTGHGVPGAFVTMLVKAIERQIVANTNNLEISTSKILSIFNKNIKKLLKQENDSSVSNAGFDGSVLYYNKRKKIIKYSSALTPLYYYQNKKMKSIKGDKHSVGYKKSDINYKYEEFLIDVNIPTQLYISTDGYLDQCGGKKGFPFNKKQFINIIEKNINESFENQKEALIQELNTYQNGFERNDDITIIGIKI